MKVFLSAIENPKQSGKNGLPIAKYFVKHGIKMKYNLMSYYYIKGKIDLAEYVRDHSEEILIDSGAHSFQFGKKVHWLDYTRQYAAFIKAFDRPNVIGYFEMDVDNVIGYDKVLELRKILEKASDKIIPVWHKERGITEYKRMCQQYAGKIIAIGGFRNSEIRDHQYLMFLKYAKKFGCKVHCLGMTRKNVLDKVPFDYTDSSSWVQQSVFGRIDGKGKVSKQFSKEKMEIIFAENYKAGQQMQEYYHRKWKKECGD